MTTEKTSGRWLTVVLVLAILALLGWIANIYLWRQAAAANDAAVKRLGESQQVLSGTGPQVTQPLHYLGGDYHFVVTDPEHCIHQLTLKKMDWPKEIAQVSGDEVMPEGEHLPSMDAGDYYVIGDTDRPDCPWEAKLIPE